MVDQTMTGESEPIVRDIDLRTASTRLFDAFTVPERIQEWFAMRAAVDLRPGGSWTFDWPPHLRARGTWVTIERPGHLVWTWDESIQDSRAESDPAQAHPTVTLDYRFTDNGDGTTRFHLVERGHGSEEVRAMNVSGIEMMLEGLRAYVKDGTIVDWTAPTGTDAGGTSTP